MLGWIGGGAEVRDWSLYRDLTAELLLVARRFPYRMFFVISGSILGGIAPIVSVLLFKELIDSVSAMLDGARADLASPFGVIFAMAGVAAINHAVRSLVKVQTRYIGFAVDREMSAELVYSASTVPLKVVESAIYQDTANRAYTSGTGRVIDAFVSMMSLVGAGISLVGMIGILSGVGAINVVIVVVGAIPAIIVSVVYNYRHRGLIESTSGEKRQMSHIVNIGIDPLYATDVRAHGSGDWLANRFRDLYVSVTGREYCLEKEKVRSDFIARMISQVSCFWVVGRLVMNATKYSISVGEFVMYVQVVLRLQRLIGEVAGVVREIHRCAVLHSMYVDACGYPSVVQKSACPEYGDRVRMDLADVFFSYPGNCTPVIRKMGLRIEGPSLIVLKGGNGAGKTTFLKLVSGLYVPTSGVLQLHVDNRRVAAESVAMYMTQNLLRYCIPIEEVYRMGSVNRDLDKDMVPIVERMLGLDRVRGRIDRNGCSRIGGDYDEGLELSGGEWKKLGLARCVLVPAPVYSLDEPFSQVDLRTKDAVRKIIVELSERSIVFVATHCDSLDQFASKVIQL